MAAKKKTSKSPKWRTPAREKRDKTHKVLQVYMEMTAYKKLVKTAGKTPISVWARNALFAKLKIKTE
jgi:hypothetical protein